MDLTRDIRSGTGESPSSQSFGFDVAELFDSGHESGLRRIAFVVASPFTPDPELEPHVQRALASGALDERTAILARVWLGRVALEAREVHVAAGWLTEALVEARAVGGEVEGQACLHYARLCARQERVFECLVIAARAKTLLEPDAAPLDLAQIEGVRIWVFNELGQWKLVEECAERATVLLDEVPAIYAQPLRNLFLASRAEAALQQGEAERAHRLCDKLEAESCEAGRSRRKQRWFKGFRADIHLRELDYDHALECVAQAKELLDPDDPGGLFLRFLEFRALAGKGRHAEAVDAGRSMLPDLGNARDILGAHGWIEVSLTVAEVLETPCGAYEESKRAFDIAANALVDRIAELDRAMGEVPQLGLVDGPDLALLDVSRWRLAEEHRHTSQAVVRMFERAARLGHEGLERLLTPGAFVTICAWCRMVRVPGGRWLPITSYLPEPAAGRLTHGMCPRCRDRIHADLTP